MVIPTYNEADNLAWIVGRLRAAQPDVDVLVVDDDSPDGTGEIADELAAADPAGPRPAPRRQGRPGCGVPRTASRGPSTPATTSSARWTPTARTSPSSCTACSTRCADADLVIGSRWVPGGSVVNWPLRRELLSRGGNLYVRLLLGIKVRDATAGYRLFRRSDAREDRPRLGGVHRLRLPDRPGGPHPARRADGREVPIEFVERVRGDSKMSGASPTESLRRITAWGLRERRDQVRARRVRETGSDADGPAQRRRAWWLLFVAFVVVPLVEIYVIIQVGQVIGPWWTILLLILDSILGTWLIKREGGEPGGRCRRRSTAAGCRPASSPTVR